MNRFDCHDAIKQTTRNYRATLQTLKAFIAIAVLQPRYLESNDLTVAELRELANELHDVYFARIFACFESCLRHYWRTTIRDTRPPTRQLLESIAARRGVPQDTLDIVQEIRDFRSFLIHEEHELHRAFTIGEASRYLNTYLARLPNGW